MALRRQNAVAAWRALARSDLRMAVTAAALQPPEWRQACFHSQQAAEKAIKALLDAHGVPVARTHDLVSLVDQPAMVMPQAGIWTESAAYLSDFAVGPRYPGVVGDCSEAAARRAVAEAQAIVDWAAEAQVPV